jgi:hypothetical protein
MTSKLTYEECEMTGPEITDNMTTDDHYRLHLKRRARSIEIQQEIFAQPPDTAFHQSFLPAQHAVQLLATIAASNSPFADDARIVLRRWRQSLATPAQMAMVETSFDLEVGGGAGISPVPGEGYWITTWTWIYDLATTVHE